MMNDIIKDEKDRTMLLNALEFFVDYKFNGTSWMMREYKRRIENIPQNDYAKLCKRLGGNARFEPEVE